MNLLYYMVTYETVIVAMMMTGKIIVGLLATVVFFSFFPVVGALIEGFEDIFFITANQCQMKRFLIHWVIYPL